MREHPNMMILTVFVLGCQEFSLPCRPVPAWHAPPKRKLYLAFKFSYHIQYGLESKIGTDPICSVLGWSKYRPNGSNFWKIHLKGGKVHSMKCGAIFLVLGGALYLLLRYWKVFYSVTMNGFSSKRNIAQSTCF